MAEALGIFALAMVGSAVIEHLLAARRGGAADPSER
jgi:hypothetical protein